MQVQGGGESDGRRRRLRQVQQQRGNQKPEEFEGQADDERLAEESEAGAEPEGPSVVGEAAEEATADSGNVAASEVAREVEFVNRIEAREQVADDEIFVAASAVQTSSCRRPQRGVGESFAGGRLRRRVGSEPEGGDWSCGEFAAGRSRSQEQPQHQLSGVRSVGSVDEDGHDEVEEERRKPDEEADGREIAESTGSGGRRSVGARREPEVEGWQVRDLPQLAVEVVAHREQVGHGTPPAPTVRIAGFFPRRQPEESAVVAQQPLAEGSAVIAIA